MSFIQKFKNARKAVQQIKQGEWIPNHSYFAGECYTAHNSKGYKLWLANGAFFCEIKDENHGNDYFGLFWRHYVWWFAARKLKLDADMKNMKNICVL